jgi:hypothetical protein
VRSLVSLQSCETFWHFIGDTVTGARTLSITTYSIMTHNIMILSITTLIFMIFNVLTMMTFSIAIRNATFSITIREIIL